MEFSEILDRIKSNKYAVPALAVGAIIGGYVLIKNGGFGGSQSASEYSVIPNQSSSGGDSGGSSSGTDTTGQTDAAITSLQNQQQAFSQSIVDQFNALVASVQSALSGQQDSTQQALNSLAQQQLSAQSANQAPLQQLSMPNLPDFNSLLSSVQSIPQVTKQAYQSPGFSAIKPQSALSLVNKIVNKNPNSSRVVAAKPVTKTTTQRLVQSAAIRPNPQPKSIATPRPATPKAPINKPKAPTFSNGRARPTG